MGLVVVNRSIMNWTVNGWWLNLRFPVHEENTLIFQLRLKWNAFVLSFLLSLCLPARPPIYVFDIKYFTRLQTVTSPGATAGCVSRGRLTDLCSSGWAPSVWRESSFLTKNLPFPLRAWYTPISFSALVMRDTTTYHKGTEDEAKEPDMAWLWSYKRLTSGKGRALCK